MVGDAEAHAADDKLFRALIESRNKADSLIHAVERTLKDFGHNVKAEDRARIEPALSDLRGALKSDDKLAIDKKCAALENAVQSLSAPSAAQSDPSEEPLYRQAQPQGPGAARGKSGRFAPADGVIDANFEDLGSKG